MSKCRWTVGRYNLVAYGRTLYLVLSSDGRTLFLFGFTIRRSIAESHFFGPPVGRYIDLGNIQPDWCLNISGAHIVGAKILVEPAYQPVAHVQCV